MDSHRNVAEQGLRPRGRDADPALRVGRAVVAGQVIADRPETAHLLAMDVLEVAEGGLAARAPVDERLPAIGESGIPQALERGPHRAGAHLVHGEPLTSPVDADTEAAVLSADVVARLVHEAPHPLEVAVAAQRLSGLSLGGDDLVQHELRGDRRVVHSGQPQRVVTEHAVIPDEGVLDRGRQGMTDVQRAGHVRRRLGDHELPGARRRFLGGRESAALQPALVDPRLDGGSVVARGKLAIRRRHRHGRTPHPRCPRTPKTRSPKDERVPRGTTFVSTLTVSVLVPALSGGTRPARVRPSPSRVRVGSQPFRPTLSMRPMEGYSSRSSPCAGV